MVCWIFVFINTRFYLIADKSFFLPSRYLIDFAYVTYCLNKYIFRHMYMFQSFILIVYVFRCDVELGLYVLFDIFPWNIVECC